MNVQPWQIPVLVMAGIILVELVVVPLLRHVADAVVKRALLTASLGLLAALLIVVGVVAAIGPSLADQLASVAAAIAGIAALWLTYRSHRPQGPPPASTAAPPAPTAAAPASTAAPASPPPAEPVDGSGVRDDTSSR
ncbi:hypothetical protein O7632_07800 [Solwaraspora sp. WMMD406]|uniref:hypothetical protein n=1 Tax=Solwaraspora sp. WMMD406 TaxID=3016095 RepID=UPI0024172F4E|nr:hypothetical protein [Solwaraspora sp. WMMD406]MDG4764007.1 hypothetical protein [Solwaraspora sp. WMMD406]